jgi:N-acetyltransferase
MTAQSELMDVRPVVLDGEHVRLEQLTLDHLDGLAAAGADESIWPWMPVHPRTRDDFRRWIEAALAEQERGERVIFAIIERGDSAVLGSTSFLAISPRNRRLEIGWTWLSPAGQRTRANTECKYLLLRHCFETLGCLRVEFKTDARNEKSRRALSRIGAREEGIFRKHQLAQHGFQRDTVYFSIVDDEWPGVKAHLEGMLAR